MKRGKILRQLLEEQDQVPAGGIIQEGHRRLQQTLGGSGAAKEPSGGAGNLAIEETARTAAQADCRPDLRITQVQDCFELHSDLIHGAFAGRRCARADVFTQVATVLGYGHAKVTCQVERRLTRLVPAIVGGQPREMGV